MSAIRNHGGAVLMVMLLALSACTSAPKSPPAPPAVPVAAAAALDASYDWHGLLLVPFGSSLKDVPFTLHEVLLFRDAAHAAQSDDAECYAMERAAPRFVARIPSGYLLCFRNDRLARVEATVYLPLNEAAGIFGDACELWLRNTAAAPAAKAATPPACEGRDGAIGYSGRLEENADQTQVPLTIRLDAIAEP